MVDGFAPDVGTRSSTNWLPEDADALDARTRSMTSLDAGSTGGDYAVFSGCL